MIFYLRLLGFCLLSLISVSLQKVNAQSALWPTINKEMKPWTRWWWMGNAVDEKNLSALLKTYQQAGLGGVEIAPIYGAKGYEDQYLQHLSAPWMDKLRYTVQQAEDLNMGVDLTNGTGWPFGGPQVDKEHAATKLIVQHYQVSKKPFIEKIKSPDEKQPDAPLLSLTAYGKDGKVLLITDRVDDEGKLHWEPGDENWDIYATFLAKTKQKVKRAAPGGDGFTLDHFSASALDQYLKPYDQAFGTQTLGVRAFYNDSYEVYGADWTPSLFDIFKQKRGYDLRLYIREFLSNDRTDHVARIKSDYRETLADMLLENFTKPWTAWAHKHHGITKNQAHGSPGNLLDLYAAVDIPEAETFGSSYFPIPGLRRDSADIRNVDPDPIMLKFASSAAHVSGKNLVSSETFTWLTEHFKTSWAQCKPEVEQAFLAGINHVFYHGTTYSPQEVKWPGWLFYASVNFVPANSLWPHLSGLNSYITNVQSILQNGNADNELLIYWPVYDAWNNPDGRDMPLKVHDIDKWLHPTPFYKNAVKLEKEGYSFDFISDHLLQNIHYDRGEWKSGNHVFSYKVLLVPKTEKMPVTTLKELIRLAQEGGTVVFQSLPTDVPGFHELEGRRKEFSCLLSEVKDMAANKSIKKGKIIIRDNFLESLQAENCLGEPLVDEGLKFIRRKSGSDSYYYIVNHTAKAVDKYIELLTPARDYYVMDPLSREVGIAETKQENEKYYVRVQLNPGESWLIKATQQQEAKRSLWTYLDRPSKNIPLRGTWEVSFKEGGPQLPKTHTISTLQPWTSFADSAARSFAGSAIYKLSINLPEIKAKEVLLQLDQVYESAKVKINGREAGIIWSIPYRLRVKDLLKKGNNVIEIEVANLMANRIKDMDTKGLTWRAYHEINFVNINYQPFDAANWKVAPAGLAGEATLILYN
jgi:hypothetical protein